MTFDKQTHLRDGSMHFTGLYAAPGLEPIIETFACSFCGCARLPVNHTKFARQLTCRCHKCKMTEDPQYLTVCAWWRVLLEGLDRRLNCGGALVDAICDQAADELGTGCSVVGARSG